VAGKRLTLTESGHVCYTLKMPYRDGTTHIVLAPLDLMAGWPHWFRRHGCT
jgi:hypothetical protein